ncbi:diaminopimelate epimerase [Rhodobaculum claviforme]|uniref:Diaminopimelate epimerase n=1 Tax=Rhodobaculum claviforme TaxID=1549854 RepID=A0A934TGW7_9RHOB|nr:diaminopimelate epimerase [Rhodobaculum claviforme]MBK5925882.1 diaminopimelate epimerase [Rhodobaculum claviforme]
MRAMTDPRPLPFAKMHGLGNDFVVIDRRGPAAGIALSGALIAALGDRHRGVGFDQLAVIDADPEGVRLTFHNPDGSVSAACGNATRCIAAVEMAATGADRLRLRTGRGVLRAERTADGVRVNMGAPLLDWDGVPLAQAMDTLHLPIAGDPVATGMGNPHCTFFVPDACAVPLEAFGPAHEVHPLFPERTNVEVATLTAPDRLRLRIWERGTGITLASGSCSCAAAVAAARRGLTGRAVTVDVDGGTLHIDWTDDGVWLAGPTAHVFDGVLTPEFLAALA